MTGFREVPPPNGTYLTAVDWHVATYSRELTSAIDGGQQIVMSPMERWTARLDFRVVKSAMRDEWEGFVADMRGRGRYARFLIAPGDAGRALQSVGVPFSDDATFSDGSMFAGSATVAVASARARTITLTGPDAALFRRGLVMDIGGDAHRITGVENATATVATVRIAPGLRRPISPATAIGFWPSVPMRFDGDDVGRLRYPAEMFADVSIALTEVFP